MRFATPSSLRTFTAYSLPVSGALRAIRAVTVERGHDPRAFALLAFGGAGPLHAIDVAKSLSIERLLIPFAPGILCAQGLVVSDLRETFVRTAPTPLSPDRLGDIAAKVDELMREAEHWFDQRRLVWFAYDTPLETPVYDRATLCSGDAIIGPALIEQLDATTLLFPRDRARVDPYLNLTVDIA
jgi:N-methylhydantoinase A/oxoprolinase/acetone carboxylase beta subunit